MRINKLVIIPEAYQDFKVCFADGAEFHIHSALQDINELAPIIFMQAMHLATQDEVNLCLTAVFKRNSAQLLPLFIEHCECNYHFPSQKEVLNTYLQLAVSHFFECLFPQGISHEQASENLEQFIVDYERFFRGTYQEGELIQDTAYICYLYQNFDRRYQAKVSLKLPNQTGKRKSKGGKKTQSGNRKKNQEKPFSDSPKGDACLNDNALKRCDSLLKQCDASLAQFIEKLRFLKQTEFQTKTMDHLAWLAALSLSPLLQAQLKTSLGLKNDLIFSREVINLLAKVESAVNFRLTGSGDDDGKSWFETDKKTVKPQDLNDHIKRFLLDATSNHDGIFSFDSSKLLKAWQSFCLTMDNDNHQANLLQNFYASNHKLNQRQHKRQVLKSIRQGLDKEIIGMQEAKDSLVNIVRDKLEGRALDQQGPLFMYGASGVGKTSLAKSLVDTLNQQFNHNYELQVFNMELFQREGAEMQLFGSGHQYNIANLGMLTSAAEFKPKRVIVFDEIEKAHANTILSLLSLLSDFKGQDKSSLREVDFSQCIFIFTSNLGQDTCHHKMASQLDFRTVLASVFPPEFVNRVTRGYLAYCPPLSEDELASFISLEATKLSQQCIFNDPTISLSTNQLDLALAVLSEELSPRAIMGQSSKLQSLLSNQIDEVEDEWDIAIEFKLYKAISLNDFISDYRQRVWLAKSRIDQRQTTNKQLISLEILEPKLAISKDDMQLPYLTFIESTDVTYQDIMGNQQALEKVQQQVSILKQSNQLDNSDTQVDRCASGLVFYGEPGAGKTHLARAVAQDYSGTFIQVNASELTIGDTDKNLKRCFEVANKYAPCIVFIDEIDSIASSRLNGRTNQNLMVNTLLTCLDGFHKQAKPVFVMAATNNFSYLDPAVIRAGRLESHIEINLPSTNDINLWLTQQLSKQHINIADNKLIPAVSEQLAGLPVLRLCELLRITKNTINQGEISHDDALKEATIEILHGEVKDTKCLSDELISTAYHEAGHAIVTACLFSVDEIFAIDIRPRKTAQGMVLINAYDQRYASNKAMLRKLVQVCLAGRAAELLYWKNEDMLSVGAGSDIAKATGFVKRAVTQLGFSLEEHLIDYRQFSECQPDVQNEVKRWMQQGHDSVTKLLEQNWEKLERLAKQLLEKKCLFKQDVVSILNNQCKPKRLH